MEICWGTSCFLMENQGRTREKVETEKKKAGRFLAFSVITRDKIR